MKKKSLRSETTYFFVKITRFGINLQFKTVECHSPFIKKFKNKMQFAFATADILVKLQPIQLNVETRLKLTVQQCACVISTKSPKHRQYQNELNRKCNRFDSCGHKLCECCTMLVSLCINTNQLKHMHKVSMPFKHFGFVHLSFTFIVD